MTALRHRGWRPAARVTAHGFLNTILAKGGWKITVSHHVEPQPGVPLSVIATEDVC